MLRWIKTLLLMVREYESDARESWTPVSRARKIERSVAELQRVVERLARSVGSLSTRADDTDRILRERTQVGVNVEHNGEGFVVVVGHYGRSDFVQCYKIPPQDMTSLIDHLRQEKRFGRITHVDAPEPFRAVIAKGMGPL